MYIVAERQAVAASAGSGRRAVGGVLASACRLLWTLMSEGGASPAKVAASGAYYLLRTILMPWTPLVQTKCLGSITLS
jgi:hypothetical protein